MKKNFRLGLLFVLQFAIVVGVGYLFAGQDGQIYQRELYSYYDDKKTKNLRVVASIFQNPVTFFCFSDSVQDDFILSPEGKFVGE